MHWDGEKYLADVTARVGKAVQASAIELVGDVRRSISTPSRTVTFEKYRGKSGMVLTRKKTGPRGSSRSKPGNPPHKDTGTLRSSIAHAMNSDGVSAKVGSALRVARFMELGVRGGKIIRPKTKKALAFNGIVRKSVKQGRIAPRPFLRPALARKHDSIKARIAKALGGKVV